MYHIVLRISAETISLEEERVEPIQHWKRVEKAIVSFHNDIAILNSQNLWLIPIPFALELITPCLHLPPVYRLALYQYCFPFWHSVNLAKMSLRKVSHRREIPFRGPSTAKASQERESTLRMI
jgi:hypothetical protein